MDKSYGIFYNVASGSGLGLEIARKLKLQLIVRQIECHDLSADSVDAAIVKIKQALPKLTALIVIGGDGTLNVAMTAMIQAGADVPVGLIPAGTINNFATRYHIPADFDEAIRLIVHDHHLRRVGIATCNETKAIVSSLTFGNLADISNGVRQEEKRRFGKIVYLAKAIQHIGKDKSFLIHYRLSDGTDRVFKTWFALITTTKSIGGYNYNEETPGKMQLSLLHNIGLGQVVPYVFFALTGKLRESKAISEFEITQALIGARKGERVMTRIDGDEAQALPIKVDFHPKRVCLMVPLAKKQ